MPLNVALLGAGIFAKDVYAKVFESTSAVQLKKVWSRSAASAEDFVAHSLSRTDAIAVHGDEGMTSIMSDPSIHIVVVVLPPQAALPAVRRALAAGKHVVEEKPLAGSLELALAALHEYRAQPEAPLWMLSENYRYENVFLEACQLAPGLLGTVVKLDLVADMAMDHTNKYYPSQWRRDTQGCAGGMIMESSVHFIAALRMLAAAVGLGEAVQATARTYHAKPDLSAPDTLVGTVSFEHGTAPASVSITLAATQVNWSLKVTGTAGCLEVSRGGWSGNRGTYVLTWKSVLDAVSQSKTFSFSGVNNAFTAFTALVEAAQAGGSSSIRGSSEEVKASAEEGARDLALVHALLQSGANHGAPIQVSTV